MSEENSQSVIFESKQTQSINFSSSHMIAELFKSSIGPYGATKLLETESGPLTLTKDGGVLLQRLTFIHPTAIFIVRAALAQEKMYHDGVNKLVTLIDAILKESEYAISDGVHPRKIVKGLQEARDIALKSLDEIAIKLNPTRSMLRDIARTAALTKHPLDISDTIVDAIQYIKVDNEPVDLDKVEILRIKNTAQGIRLVKGVVLDQGFRNDMMPKQMKNVRILAMNISLELEPSTYATYAPVANADQKERLMIAERRFVDDKVKAIIALKDICNCDFLVVNGKGIDTASLDIFSRAGISALRRVSAKNINRFIHACGCHVVNCVDDLSPSVLGFAGKVTEESYKGQKYVYVDEVKDPKAVTIVVGGVNDQVAGLITDGVKDSLRSLKQALDDDKVLPGAACTEAWLSNKIMEEMKTVSGEVRIGAGVYSLAIMELVRVLVKNSGHDPSDIIPDLQGAIEDGDRMGVDAETGEIVDPADFGYYDSYSSTRALLQSAPLVASQLLLVDQIIESKTRREKPHKQSIDKE